MVKYTECVVEGCNTLTKHEHFCLKHNRRKNICKHFYEKEKSITVGYCGLTDERENCKCENYYPLKKVWLGEEVVGKEKVLREG